MKHSIIIDLLDDDLARRPKEMEDTLIIRNYSVPNDNDLAIDQTKRILRAIMRWARPVDAILTIYIPLSALAFGMVNAIARRLDLVPRIIVVQGGEETDLSDFYIFEEFRSAKPKKGD